MQLNRRQLVQSLAAAPLAATPIRLFAAPSPAAPPRLRSAIAAIAAYAEVHRRTMGVPGLTVGLTAPGLPSYPIRLGFTDHGRTRAVTADTLFQVGSISKMMTATMIHQLVAEGRLALDDQPEQAIAGVRIKPVLAGFEREPQFAVVGKQRGVAGQAADMVE